MERVRRNWTVSDRLKHRALGLALTLCCWGTFAGLAAGCLVDTPMAPAPGSVRIERRDDHLSVSARKAPWAEVLRALERHTGVRIHAKGLLAGKLTCEFEAIPLEQGLRRLFREVNTVFFYASSPHTTVPAAPLTQVWLVPRDDSATVRPPASPPADSAAAEPEGAPGPQQETTEGKPGEAGATLVGEETGAAERR